MASEGQAQPLDLRILVDASAVSTRTDPQNLRGQALDLLVRLLPRDASAGIWAYAEGVESLLGPGQVDDMWQRRAAALLAVDLPVLGGAADLSAAIAATLEPRAASGVETPQVLVITSAAGDWQTTPVETLQELLASLGRGAVRVNVLQLPPERVEISLPQRLSQVTAGYFVSIPDAAALNDAVAQLAEQIGGASRIPVEDGESFLVPTGLKEFTVMRVRSQPDHELALIDPASRVLTRQTANQGFRWHQDRGYDLVTITEPAAGRWYFRDGSANGSRIVAVGDLETRLQGLPPIPGQGALRVFELVFAYRGKPLTDPDFQRLMTVEATVARGDVAAAVFVEPDADGRFLLRPVNLDPGDYTLTARISGPTFTRETRLPFTVLSPLAVHVVPVAQGAVAWLAVNAPELDVGTLDVVGQATFPGAVPVTLSARRLPGGLWKMPVDGPPGTFKLVIDVEGNYLNGKSFKLRTAPMVDTLPLAEGRIFNLSAGGALVARRTIDDSAQSTVVPTVDPQPRAEPAAVEESAPGLGLPGWFAAVLAVVNLAIGLAAWFLLAPPRLPEGVLALLALEPAESTAAEAEAA